MKKLIKSAFADEYSADLSEQISALKKHGIENLELRSVGGKFIPDISISEAKEIKKVLDGEGITVSALGSPLGKVVITENMNDYNEKSEHIFDVADIMGTKLVRCFSFYSPNGDSFSGLKNLVFDEFGELVKRADRRGITLCHENEAKIYGESPEKCFELLEYFGGKMKCVFDMGNFVLDGFTPYPDAYDLLKKHIEYFHIKDALSVGAIVPPGKGEAKIKEILKSYSETADKNAFITLEPHLQTFSGLNALVGKKFDNPYKYENQKVAFDDAAEELNELLKIL